MNLALFHAVPAPVELGQRVHRYRARPSGCPAARGLKSLFAGQWRNGKVPHIVFDPCAPPGSYFSGPDHRATAAESPDAPFRPVRTSGLCQPPVHVIRRILEVAQERDGGEPADTRRFLDMMYPKLLAWPHYLATERDPEGSGLVTIFHPWESGTDNSSRWDAALEAMLGGEVPHYERKDFQHVEDASERPTDPEYDRYLWLSSASSVPATMRPGSTTRTPSW